MFIPPVFIQATTKNSPYDLKDVFTVIFSDLPGAVTEGKTLIGAIEMASDCACGWIIDSIENCEPIPVSSTLCDVAADEYDNGFVSLVLLDIDEYQERHCVKSVRKNCTIPAWLNTAAEKNSINFSEVLQEGLIQRLGIKISAANSINTHPTSPSSLH